MESKDFLERFIVRDDKFVELLVQGLNLGSKHEMEVSQRYLTMCGSPKYTEGGHAAIVRMAGLHNKTAIDMAKMAVSIDQGKYLLVRNPEFQQDEEMSSVYMEENYD